MTRPVLKTSTALVCGIAALSVFLIAWFAHEYHSFQREGEAVRILRDEYGASFGRLVHGPGGTLGALGPEIDLWRLRQGRIYSPAEVVSIRGATIDQRAWESLSALRSLAYLEISNCRIGESVDVDFSVFRDLQALDVTSTPLSASQIGTLAGLERLEGLDLGYMDAGDEPVKIVSQLPSLRSLKLKGAKITDEAISLIGRPAHLIFLDLSETGITDESLGSLGTLKSLAALRLSDTNVTDAGVAKLRCLPSLVGVALDGTRISRGSMSLLAEIPTLKRDKVMLDNTAIDAAELERWKAGEPIATDPASE